jgi:16S rRNA (adenine1518-N6/adenine1519-N6)-dimethyltransferase
LTPLGDARPPIDHPERFARIVAAAFGQRRKTLRNALRSICTADTLERLGFDPGARGETLGVADFARLANLAPDLAGNAADASTGGVRATTRTADPTR